MEVIKRNGRKVEFDVEKIVGAISKAFTATGGYEEVEIEYISELIGYEIEDCLYNHGYESIGVEEIQDMVEDKLIKGEFNEVAINYVRYRENRRINRELGAEVINTVETIIDGSNHDVLTENANKKGHEINTQRDLIAGSINRIIAEKMIPEDIINAHRDGLIHVHDTDYYAQPMTNCGLVNLEDVLQNGTVLNGVKIEKPKSLRTAATVATQIALLVSSNQYGGQTMSIAHLAPFVRVSKEKIINKFKSLNLNISDDDFNKLVDKELKEEIKDSIQTYNYQLNSMASSNGQSPFCTLELYLDSNKEYVEETAMLIEEVLKQRIVGLKNPQGNYVAQFFPKLLYFMDENNAYEGSKYFYLTELACKCASKRMAPEFVSVKKMKELYGYAFPCMGCVDGKEVINYKINNTTYIESFERAWNRLRENNAVGIKGESEYIKTNNIKIYDNNLKDYTKVYGFIKNKTNKWFKVKLSGGRVIKVSDDHPFETENRGVVLARDLQLNDEIKVNYENEIEENLNSSISEDRAWLLGLLLREVSYSEDINMGLGLEEKSIKDYFENRHIPNFIFSEPRDIRMAFMCGMIDADGYTNKGGAGHGSATVQIGSTNKELAIQQLYLAQSLGLRSYMYEDNYSEEHQEKIKYIVEFKIAEDMNKYLRGCKKIEHFELREINNNLKEGIVKKIEFIEEEGFSYDVTTESEHFEVSGIYSHNCRSFLSPWYNKDGNVKFFGRLNVGVQTINLPYVALLSQKENKDFFDVLEEKLQLCKRMGELRFEKLRNVKASVSDIWRNGVYGRLNPEDSVYDYIKDGYATVSLGYSGIYETVKILTGESHTQPIGNALAITIMEYLDDTCKQWKKESGYGWGLYGTPSESTAGVFARAIEREFGEIKDVTDKGYITNSFHVDVREEIDAFTKLSIEAELGKYSLGGVISYVEVGDMQKNVEAVIQLAQFMYETCIYGEVNLTIDYCECCNSQMEAQLDEDLNWYCTNCGNKDKNKLEVVRRICGYIQSAKECCNSRKLDIKNRVKHL